MTQHSPIYDAIVVGAGVSGTATHGFRYVLIQISLNQVCWFSVHRIFPEKSYPGEETCKVLERRMNYTRFLFMRYNRADFCFLFLLCKEKHNVRRPGIWRVKRSSHARYLGA